jgi:hypothetical protein
MDAKNLDFDHRLLIPNGSIKHVHVLAQPFKINPVMLNLWGREEVVEASPVLHAVLPRAAKVATPRIGEFATNSRFSETCDLLR